MKKVNKGASALKKIVAEARKIRIKSPGMKWTECIKKAAKSV